MELHFDASVEKINIKNNTEWVLSSLLANRDDLHNKDMITVHSTLLPRLQSSLQSMLYLYNFGEIAYSQFSFYLSQHNRVLETMFSLIELQKDGTLSKNSIMLKSLIRKVDTLTELAEELR